MDRIKLHYAFNSHWDLYAEALTLSNTYYQEFGMKLNQIYFPEFCHSEGYRAICASLPVQQFKSFAEISRYGVIFNEIAASFTCCMLCPPCVCHFHVRFCTLNHVDRERTSDSSPLIARTLKSKRENYST